MKNEDTYKEVRVFQYGNITARVHIPDLTDAEYERRRAAVERAARALLLSRDDPSGMPSQKKPEK